MACSLPHTAVTLQARTKQLASKESDSRTEHTGCLGHKTITLATTKLSDSREVVPPAKRKTTSHEYLEKCVDNYLELEYRLVTSQEAVRVKLKKRKGTIEHNSFQRDHVYRDNAKFPSIKGEILYRQLEVIPPAKDKYLVRGSVASSGYASHMGGRQYQEDVCIIQKLTVRVGPATHNVKMYAVFDGHGGKECAKRVSVLMPGLLMARLSEYYRRFGDMERTYFNALKIAAVDAHCIVIRERLGEKAGCTGTIVLKEGNNLWIGCTGDSPALLIDPSGEFIPLTEDASPKNPEYIHSVHKRGLSITKDINGCDRVHHDGIDGGINMARAYGNEICSIGISARPKIHHLTLPGSPHCGYTLVIASDGLFELIKHRQIGSLAHDLRQNGHKPTDIASQLVDAAEVTYRQTMTSKQGKQNLSNDNTSAIVAFLS